MMLRRLASLGLAAVLLLGFTACRDQSAPAPSSAKDPNSSTPPLPPGTEKTFRLQLEAEPKSLDPSIMTDVVGSACMEGLMEPLVKSSPTGEPTPALASRWEHNEDYTTWTFHMRPEAKWHNGEPVTAQDCVYSAQRICTPRVGGQYASMVYGFLKGGEEYYKAGGLDGKLPFEGVEAVDTHTVRYHMANPTPFFTSVLYLFSWLPLNQKAVEAGGEGWALNPKTFVGNGPFRMTEFRSGDRMVAVRADTYWDAKNIFWDSVEWYFIDNQTTANAAFVTGQLDVTMTVPISELETWRGKPEYHLYRYFGTYYIGFCTTRPPFEDARVRVAFSKAIDRKLLTERITKRFEPVSVGLIPGPLPSPRGGDYRDHAKDLIGPQDVAAARALIAEAGYGPSKALPSIEYLYNTSEEHKMIAEQLQAMWRNAFGVDVKLQNLDWGVKLQRTIKGDFQIARLGWYGDYLDPMTFLELFTSTSTQNDPQYKNPKYDDLIARARKEGDAVKREDLLIQAETLLMQDMVVAPLYSYQQPMLVRTDVEGVNRTTVGGILFARAKRSLTTGG